MQVHGCSISFLVPTYYFSIFFLSVPTYYFSSFLLRTFVYSIIITLLWKFENLRGNIRDENNKTIFSTKISDFGIKILIRFSEILILNFFMDHIHNYI